MRALSIWTLLVVFSTPGYGGPLDRLFCPTICNPQPEEPLRTCFYRCGFLKYGKYFDGSPCWYLVGTGKIVNARGFCNQGICLKVFTAGYKGSDAQKNCEVNQTKILIKNETDSNETGVKGVRLNVTQANEQEPSKTGSMSNISPGLPMKPGRSSETTNGPFTKTVSTEPPQYNTVKGGGSALSPPARLSEAQVTSPDEQKVALSIQAAGTSSPSEKATTQITSTKGSEYSTPSRELPVETNTNVVPETPSVTKGLLSVNNGTHHNGTRAQEPNVNTETLNKFPTEGKRAPAATFVQEIPKAEELTTSAKPLLEENITAVPPGLSTEPGTPSETRNRPFTKTISTESPQYITGKGGGSVPPPPGRLPKAPATSLDEQMVASSNQPAGTSSSSKEATTQITSVEGVYSTPPAAQPVETNANIAPETPARTKGLLPGDKGTQLNGTRAQEPNAVTQTGNAFHKKVDQTSASVVTLESSTPKAEHLITLAKPLSQENGLSSEKVATTHSQIPRVDDTKSSSSKTSEETAITKPEDMSGAANTQTPSRNASGKFSMQKFASIVDALRNAGTKWFLGSSGKSTVHEGTPQGDTTAQPHEKPGANNHSLLRGEETTAVTTTKQETQPATERITKPAVTEIFPVATRPPNDFIKNATISASDNIVPCYSIIIAPSVIVVSFYVFVN